MVEEGCERKGTRSSVKVRSSGPGVEGDGIGSTGC